MRDRWIFAATVSGTWWLLETFTWALGFGFDSKYLFTSMMVIAVCVFGMPDKKQSQGSV